MQEIFIQNGRRQVFNLFLEKLQMLVPGIEIDKALIMPLVLKVTKPLVNGTSNYKIDLVKGTSVLLQMETKLEKDDIFIAQSIGLGIQKFDAASASIDNAEPLFNHPDPVYFGAAASKQLNKIYEGKSSIKVGGQTIIDGLDNMILKVVPNGGFAGTIGTPTDASEFGATNEQRGLVDLGVYPILFGSSKNELEIALAPGVIDAIAGSGATANNVVLYAYGFVYRGQMSNNGACVAAL